MSNMFISLRVTARNANENLDIGCLYIAHYLFKVCKLHISNYGFLPGRKTDKLLCIRFNGKLS